MVTNNRSGYNLKKLDYSMLITCRPPVTGVFTTDLLTYRYFCFFTRRLNYLDSRYTPNICFNRISIRSRSPPLSHRLCRGSTTSLLDWDPTS